MTVSVDPRHVAAINALTPRCETLTATQRRCGAPAAWVLTWTTRHSPTHRAVTVACLACMVQVTAHLRGHQPCRDAFTITTAEI